MSNFQLMMTLFQQKKLTPMGVIWDKMICISIKLENYSKKKIIGITCHNSIRLAKEAIKNKPDYIALGAFSSSKTKKVKFKAETNLLIKVKKFTPMPIVAIGGINNLNYKKLLLNKANFLAISSYIWNNKKLKPEEAIKELR